METDYDTKGPGNAFKLRKYTAAGFLQTLDAFCEDRGLNRKDLEDKLDMIDYAYDPAVNQFV